MAEKRSKHVTELIAAVEQFSAGVELWRVKINIMKGENANDRPQGVTDAMIIHAEKQLDELEKTVRMLKKGIIDAQDDSGAKHVDKKPRAEEWL